MLFHANFITLKNTHDIPLEESTSGHAVDPNLDQPTEYSKKKNTVTWGSSVFSPRDALGMPIVAHLLRILRGECDLTARPSTHRSYGIDTGQKSS